MQVLLASSNKGKLKEIVHLLKDLPVEILLPKDIGLNLDVSEDGETYAENARKKALAYCGASGLVTLADDTGLEVEVLGGQPGLHSARFTGKTDATDASRRAFLLEKLKELPRPWRAAFRCTVAVAAPDGRLFTMDGACQGEIITEERGVYGFGYDPIFLVDGTGKTMAELTLEEKNTLSHRARAVMATRPVLLELAGE